MSDTLAMTDAELADAQTRYDAYKRSHDHPEAFACCSAHASADDVPGLLAEVKRLHKANKDLARHSLRTMERAAKAEAQLAKIGETTVEWGIRTDSTDHAPDSPNFGSDQKAILNYPMDERHARKHSKPWGWQAIYRVVGQWHNADQEADRG